MSKSLKPFKSIVSNFITIEDENIDTDQILPARFLTTTSRKGMAERLFYDWRYDANGNEVADCIFNQTKAKTAKILVAGANFGCGSSREHAPWALYDFGFRVVLSTEFADIFKNNSLKNGLLPIIVDKKLINWLHNNPDAEIEVDLEAKQVRYGQDNSCDFEIDAFARRRILDGMDELDFLLAQAGAIKLFEEKHG